MKRWLRLAGSMALSLILAALAIYLGLVHPNDARVDGIGESPARDLGQRFRLVASLLGDGIEHANDVDAMRLARAKEAAAQAIGTSVIQSSVRFKSPYQMYVPVGRYPVRLDARDALLVPAGTTLVVEPKFEGNFELRFAAVSTEGKGTLVLGVEGKGEHGRIALSDNRRGSDTEGGWYKNFGRYLDPDQADEVQRWETRRFRVPLASTDRLTFHCEGEAADCLVSDVEFYQDDPEPAKNVLVIMIDTLRGDALDGGNAPRLSALRDEAIAFDRALAGGNMTSPSTNAFLSCRLPSQLGDIAFSYGVSPDYRESYYERRKPSFPDRFKEARLDTTMIGNVSVISEIYGVGVDHGFRRQVSLEVDGYDTPQIAREAVRWLEENGDHRFFLYLHFNAPHAPYRAPLSYLFQTFPGLAVSESYSKTLHWLYQAEVAFTDRYVGKVLDAVKRLGLAESTVVVVTADHGDQHENRRFDPNDGAPPFEGAFFDHGATLLNDEIRVPLLFKVPGLVPRRVADFASTLDTGATLIDLMGMAGLAECSGRSLLPYLQGASPGALTRRVLGSEGFQGRMVLFDNRYKYVRLYGPTDKRVHGPTGWGGEKKLYYVAEQLFDLEVDPGETKDISRDRQDLMLAARDTYRARFDVKDSFEVIVETPGKDPVEMTLKTTAEVEVEEGEGRITRPEAGLVRVDASAASRHLIQIKGPLAEVPEVRIAGEVVPVRKTSLRLPLGKHPGALPAEVGGINSLLDPSLSAVAYLRRVEDDGQENRQILTGNAAFEKVLREWGYLNDK